MPFLNLQSLARASQEPLDALEADRGRAKEVFQQAYKLPPPRKMTLESSGTFRAGTFYRILRHIMRALGQLSQDESLSSRLQEVYRANGSPVLLTGHPDPTIKQAIAIQEEMRRIPKMALIPIQGSPVELETLERVYNWVAKELQLDHSVTSLFTHPSHYITAIPSAGEIAEYEEDLFQAIYEELRNKGVIKARQELQRVFGMRPREAQELVSAARYAIASSIEVDQETERKIQSDRLEQLMATARESMDTRMELASIKERNRLLGLTDRPPKDTTKEIMDVISHVTSEENVYEPDFTVTEDSTTDQ